MCLPFLIALMIDRGRIDPRCFTPEYFADPALLALAARVTIVADGNLDPNAMSPQHLTVALREGVIELDVPHTLGSPEAPLSATQAASKYALCRDLAHDGCDPRIFSDPLAYLLDR